MMNLSRAAAHATYAETTCEQLRRKGFSSGTVFVLRNMKKKISRNKRTTHKVRDLNDLFSDQWKEKVKITLDEMKGSDNGLSRSLGNLFELVITYRCLSDIALEYAPRKLFSKIVVDTETVCNELGTSLIREGDEVNTCLTKRHSDCKGSYSNSHASVKRNIVCKCKCHRRM